MPSFHTSHTLIAAILLIGTAGVYGQDATNQGSLSGRVLAEDGHPVHATVALSFAAPRGYPAPPRRVLTGANGAFTFSHLSAGQYTLCAQVAATEPAPADSPYIDTCVWGSGQPPLTLAPGQQLTGVVFTALKGALMSISVVDPDHVLPAAVAKTPAPLDPAIRLTLKGPDGLYRHARFVGATPAGRTYQIVIPLKTALTLHVASSVADVFDQNGKHLQPSDDTLIQPSTPAALIQPVVTLRRQ